jgi:hypothetical protein
VDVVFNLFIDNVELVDKLFKLLKIVVDVLFKLMRFEFIVNTDKPDVVIFPTTFNVLFIVVILFNVVDPATFNDDNNVDELETTKLEKLVLLFKLLIDNVELVDKLFKLLKIVVDVLFNLFIDNVELVDNEFKLLNIVVDVAFKLLIDDIVFGPMTDPPTFNDDNIVALFDIKLYEVISYIPELFIILFIIY